MLKLKQKFMQALAAERAKAAAAKAATIKPTPPPCPETPPIVIRKGPTKETLEYIAKQKALAEKAK